MLRILVECHGAEFRSNSNATMNACRSLCSARTFPDIGSGWKESNNSVRQLARAACCKLMGFIETITDHVDETSSKHFFVNFTK
mmetsp:Transcript_23111/g.54644  ORF Transcript_23111/g.54644 Transcript_23111/m.54644 type:complete len:84 (-) Transcript_23111:54-305(-)